jgi:hypothetical protein
VTSTTEEELQVAGVTALVKELGPLKALRFHQLMNVRSGDYTAEWEAIIGDPTFDELMASAQALSRHRAE